MDFTKTTIDSEPIRARVLIVKYLVEIGMLSQEQDVSYFDFVCLFVAVIFTKAQAAV